MTSIEARLHEVRERVSELIQAHPLPAAALAFGLGIVVGGAYKIVARSRDPRVRATAESMLASVLGVLGEAATARFSTQARSWLGVAERAPN